MSIMPPILGGSSNDFVTLYHYTRESTLKGATNWWTDWEAKTVASANRMTGVPDTLIKYRLTIRVNRNKLGNYFSNANNPKLKLMPGGHAYEYLSKVSIERQYISIDAIY